jgi:hypothetical protein
VEKSLFEMNEEIFPKVPPEGMASPEGMPLADTFGTLRFAHRPKDPSGNDTFWTAVRIRTSSNISK